MEDKFVVKDSGVREKYDSGMNRDTQEGKPDYTLIDISFLTRLANHLVKGAKKYGEDNWRLANSIAELKRFKKSAFRHLIQWLRGDLDEDHGSAVVFNIMAAEHVREKIGSWGEPQEDDSKIFTVIWKNGEMTYEDGKAINQTNHAVLENISFVIPGRHARYMFTGDNWAKEG